MAAAMERHYSVGEIAEAWNLSPYKVSRMFRDVDGVLKIGRDNYVTLRIPASVLEQFHADRSRGFRLKVKGSGGAVK